MAPGKPNIQVRSNEIGPESYTTHKANPEWIQDLNARPETIKLLGENKGGRNPLTLVLAMAFLDVAPNVQAIKAKINKRGSVKAKASAKEATK